MQKVSYGRARKPEGSSTGEDCLSLVVARDESRRPDGDPRVKVPFVEVRIEDRYMNKTVFLRFINMNLEQFDTKQVNQNSQHS